MSNNVHCVTVIEGAPPLLGMPGAARPCRRLLVHFDEAWEQVQLMVIEDSLEETTLRLPADKVHAAANRAPAAPEVTCRMFSDAAHDTRVGR